MRLVEQPQPRAANDHGCERHPAPLPRREAGDGNGPQTFGESDPVERGIDDGVRTIGAHGAGPEAHVIEHGQVVVEARVVPEQADERTDGPAVGDQVDAEDQGVALGDGHESCTGAQQGGLASTVGSLQQHDLASGHVEIDAGQCGKATEQTDRSAESDDGVHEQPNGTGGPRSATNPAEARPRGFPATTGNQMEPRLVSPLMLSKVLGGIGRTLITAGTLILLFVAYQLWGTGLQEAKAQKVLSKDFEAQLASVDQTTTTTAPPTTTTAVLPPGSTPKIAVEKSAARTQDLPLPATGEPVAKIRIPSIGVNRTVVEGVGLDQLKRGPGHYPETPLPGQKGNVAIAGHRTTYGQPFHNVDKVKIGDQVIFETLQGTFVYEITESKIVEQDQVEILEEKGDNRVTLIACHPKYSAAQRFILIGKLVGKPAPPLTGQAEAQDKAREENNGDALAKGSGIDGGLSGTTASKWPAIFWGLVAASIWFVTWVIQTLLRRRVRSQGVEGERPSRAKRLLTWTPYLVGVPIFMVALYVFFENFGRLLPGNY